MKLWWEIDQGSVAWYKLRGGIPTASRFGEVMTPKKRVLAEARKRYACQIISVRLLNWQAESLDKITHIAAGKEYEPIAVRQLEMIEGVETVPVGFVTSDDGRYGASPDRLIGVQRGEQPDEIPCTLEVKSPTVPVQMERIIFGAADDYPCQVQGHMLTCHARRAVFYSARERMPAVYLDTARDEAFIRSLRGCLSEFCDELDEWTEIAKQAGAYQMFEEIKAPAETEYASQLQANEETLAGVLHGELGDRLSWAG